MKHNFITRFLGPGDAAAGLSPLGPIIAGAQAAAGIIQMISGGAKMKRALAERKAYVTPDEYFKIFQATQSNAQHGFDPTTLNYLTNQTDRAFDQATGAATRLGADPNDLSALFDQKLQAMMKIGAENHQLNMENFSKYLGALDVLGQNKAAEWKSQQDIVKDKIQAASAEKQAGLQNVGSAANAAIGLSASSQTMDLYKQIENALKALKGTTGGVKRNADGSISVSGTVN